MAEAALHAVGMAERIITDQTGFQAANRDKQVAINRALVNNQRIIMADEPTGALDTHG